MTTPDTAAMRARLQAAKWQPIETAPHDGTPILAMENFQTEDEGGGLHDGDWMVVRWRETKHWTGWTTYGLHVPDFAPTHWMPLPPAPGKEQPGAALREAYDARGEEIERLRAEKEDADKSSAEFIDLINAEVEKRGARLTAAAEGARARAVREFAGAILHGDDVHRQWLLEAAEAFIAGQPMPPPRAAIRRLAAPATGDANG